jgi:hypothetical protein
MVWRSICWRFFGCSKRCFKMLQMITIVATWVCRKPAVTWLFMFCFQQSRSGSICCRFSLRYCI